MRIRYLRLENFNGIYHGMRQLVYEQTFNLAAPIIQLAGGNGCGKSTVIEALTPSSTSLSSANSLILEGRDGEKIVEIEHNNFVYRLRHSYTRNGSSSILTKSYVSKDNEELNPNGNVTSFRDILARELGWMPKYAVLTTMGNSHDTLIDMTSQARKSTISSILFENNEFDSIYKQVNPQLTTYKRLNAKLIESIDGLCLDDDDISRSTESRMRDRISSSKSKLEEINHQIYDLKTNLQSINTLKEEKDKLERELHQAKTTYSSLDEVNGLIFDLKMQIQTYEQTILDIGNETSNLNSHLQQVYAERSHLQEAIAMGSDTIGKLKAKKDELEKIERGLDDLRSKDRPLPVDMLNEIIQLLLSADYMAERVLGSDPKTLAKLKKIMMYGDEKKKEIVSDMKHSLVIHSAKIVDRYMNKLFPVVELGESFSEISLYEWYMEYQSLVESDIQSHSEDETSRLSTLLELSSSITKVSQYLSRIVDMCSPLETKITSHFTQVLENFNTKLEYVPQASHFTNFTRQLVFCKNEMSILSERLHDVKQEIETLESHKDISSWDSMVNRSSSLGKEIDTHLNRLRELSQDKMINMSELAKMEDKLKEVEDHGMMLLNNQRIQSKIDLIASDLLQASKDEEALHNLISTSKRLGQEIEQDEYNLTDLRKRLEIYTTLKSQLDENLLSIKELGYISEATSVKSGIPMLGLRSYLERMNSLANTFLDVSHHGSLTLPPFTVDESEMTIPFIKDGHLIEDVRYASSGEKVFLSSSISFALLGASPSKYRILRMDEVDASLDPDHKNDFFKTLCVQLRMLGCDQLFIVTHNPMFDDSSICTKYVLDN